MAEPMKVQLVAFAELHDTALLDACTEHVGAPMVWKLVEQPPVPPGPLGWSDTVWLPAPTADPANEVPPAQAIEPCETPSSDHVQPVASEELLQLAVYVVLV
jgi:hypothetical protein